MNSCDIDLFVDSWKWSFAKIIAIIMKEIELIKCVSGGVEGDKHPCMHEDERI